MKDIPKQSYDVVVIGGGPAGMMAAGRAGEAGARVLLIEKNPALGQKLLITGGGRCNITNAEFDTRKLVEKYGDKGKFLFSPFSQFGVKETFHFFESHNVPLKIEAENRAFPQSNSAVTVFNALHNYLVKNNVTIFTHTEVTGFTTSDNRISSINIRSTKHPSLKEIDMGTGSCILTTGGKSRPETGSTGDGFTWLSKIGHTVQEPHAALVPITIKEEWCKTLQGLSLNNVRVTTYQNNIKQDSRVGKLLFTHFGLSGPVILNMSKDMRELFSYGDVSISLDFFPKEPHNVLDLRLQDVWKKGQNKYFKNSLVGFVPPKLAPILVERSGIDPELFVNKVPRASRLALIKLIKDFLLTLKGFLGEEKAIVTSGGLDLNEVDFKTMQSRKYANLFVAGDILDFDRPSGGFSLQICWTTGYIAGTSAVKNIER